jgi:hypothetical protein|tara:strand:+ start:585 stop:830 length:246 start_codon:yes stop_codon:yes gene_type:complete
MKKIPDWFRGTVYKEGGEVRNSFSGEKCKLNAEELSMYDFIMGAQLIMEMGAGNEQSIMEMRRGLDWFRENNIKAYKTLLD